MPVVQLFIMDLTQGIVQATHSMSTATMPKDYSTVTGAGVAMQTPTSHWMAWGMEQRFTTQTISL